MYTEREAYAAKATEAVYNKIQERKVFKFLSTEDPDYVKGVIEAALQEAYDQGAEEGYSLGREEGWKDGYEQGCEDTQNNLMD